MRFKSMVLAAAMALTSTAAFADLTPWKDYTESDAVWWVTAVKVHPNMEDAYLEGLKKTWVGSMEVRKKLGQLEDFHIFRSDLPGGGDFNMLLVVKFKNDGQLTPNKAAYEAFMKELGEAQSKKATETAQRDYPAMRDITGEYRLREITLK